MLKEPHIKAHESNATIAKWLNSKDGRQREISRALSIYRFKLVSLLNKPLTLSKRDEVLKAIELVSSQEHNIPNPYAYITSWAKAKRGRIARLCNLVGCYPSRLASYEYFNMSNAFVNKCIHAMNVIEAEEVSKYTNKIVIDWVNERHGRITALAKVMGTTKANEHKLLSKVRYITKDMYEVYMEGIAEVMANEDPLVYETPELDNFINERKFAKSILCKELGKSSSYINKIVTRKTRLKKSAYEDILKAIHRLQSTTK